ncbi:MAG: ABC transporter ATP-binding protein [Proteobacteria bacterium]|nr:ABC transporter ATP-binding protein [Pseudomonadota bacterium]
MSDFRALLSFAAPYRAALALSALLMLLESTAALVVPWAGGLLTDVLLKSGDTSSAGTAPVRIVLLGMLGLFVLQALLKFGNTYILGNAADRIVSDLKIRLYDHLQALPLAYYQQRRLGDTLALLTNDVYVLTGFISGTALALVPLLFTAGGAVVLMFRIRPALALLAVILIPVFYLLMKIAGRRMRPLSGQIQGEYAGAVAIAQENLGMLPAIKTFTRENQESARYRGQIERIFRLSVKQRGIYAALDPLAQLIAAMGIVLVLALASSDLAEGRLAPAQLVSFLLYAALLTRPVAGLADVYGQTQMTRGAFARLRQAMEEPREPAADVGIPLQEVSGAIEFQSVHFGYEGRPAALEEVDLRIAAGETVAIVGPNGAGKSTLGHLLMRLHEPSAGKILIDGIDTATVSLESLRRQIGVVPQHVLLFNATVRDNIAYGRPEPSPEEIEAAARAARAHDFISALPQGYDTMIGDRGVRLSGGQQQRLALARALLKDPPILILDEATAMFDPQGEAEFLQACHDTPRRRTVLLITHRPASLAAADRIVRMEQGRIVAMHPCKPAQQDT